MRSMKLAAVLAAFAVLTASHAFAGFQAFITMTNGYFFDPAAGKTWVPHGIAYQTWNRPLGVWQTKAQIDYDLDEMVKMGANSIRVDFVWQQIEDKGDNIWSWDNYDYLIQACEQRGIRIFALIGYQWPPAWFPDDWYTMHPPSFDSSGIYHPTRWTSDIINYEHPLARAQYAEFFNAVCSRYKDSKAVVAWITGNEYGYLGLWSGLLDGYDPLCEQAFRNWCQAKYATVSNANLAWGLYQPAVKIDPSSTTPSLARIGERPMIATREGTSGLWLSVNGGADSWTTRLIGYDNDIEYLSLAQVDGRPAVAYDNDYGAGGYGALRYVINASADGSGAWSYKTIATQTMSDYPGQYVSMITVTGKPFIAATMRRPLGPITYYSLRTYASAQADGLGNWTSNEIDSGNADLHNSNLELVGDKPAIAYAKGTNLYFAAGTNTDGGGAWTKYFVTNGAPYVYVRSLALLNGKPAILFQTGGPTYYDLKVAVCSSYDGSGTWTTMTAGNNSMYGAKLSSLSGRPAITYVDGPRARLVCAINSAADGSGAWSPQDVAIASGGSLAMAPLGSAAGLSYAYSNDVWFVSLPDPGWILTSFGDLRFVDRYAEYGVEGAQWADAVQWREDSIANYTALGAKAARLADTNHLLSYSTVGMQWGEENWRYHAEDRGKITAACAATNAPLSFFSVNNYPWSVLGHESQNGQWGVSFTKKVSKIPVLYTETGFTSSETMWPGMNEMRQGPLIRNSLWESLECGAIGTHIFSWMDRTYITDREKGFGIVYADRSVKPAFWVSRDTCMLMEQIKLRDLLSNSKDPKPDIAFLWTAAADSQYNRYECEMQQIAGALERLGFEPNFMDLQDLAGGAYTNYKAVILPRNMRVDSVVPGFTNSVLNFLLTKVIPKGVHVLASADIPGMQNENGRPRADYVSEVAALFGVNASDPSGYEVPPRTGAYVSTNTVEIRVSFTNAMGALTNGYSIRPRAWKASDRITLTNGGALWATMDSGWNRGFEDHGAFPWGWHSWGDVYIRNWYPMDGTNMLQMWGDAGVWQEIQAMPGMRYVASFWLRSNASDPLRNGKQAYVALEFWDEAGANKLATFESAHLTTNTPGDSWVEYRVDAIAPAGAARCRRLIRIGGSGDGSVFADAPQRAPALVVKDHGAAKAAIFLFSAGDIQPDGDGNWDPDPLPWKWRFDYLGAITKGYFGLKPTVEVAGTNAFLCLPEYRTCADSSTLWQVKNYLYDRFDANGVGGWPQTFTIISALFSNKTIRAFQQGKIVETNSDGTIQLTLDPDGQEILWVYPKKTNDLVCQLMDAPAVVHPFGDKNYTLKVKYDTQGQTNLVLKIALTGGGYTNKIYQMIATNVSGAGEQTFWMYIPDASQTDTNYVSTPDGGSYQFVTWLETASSNVVTPVASQATELEWGVRPLSTLPQTFAKGATTNFSLEWEELYETLYWQHTPMARNDAFPTRVAVFRSTKTEAQFPGHFERVNQVCDWLESMGYTNGDLLDVSFDNVTVTAATGAASAPMVLFSDNMESGSNGWSATGLWHRAKDLYASPTNSWAYNNGTNYNTGARNSGALVSPWINLTNGGGAILTFKSWYETEDTSTSWDKKLLYLSTDGTNWTQVLQVSGPNKQWATLSFDLAAYAGRSIRLKFFFDTMDAVYNTFRGWYVDDVQVAAAPTTTIPLFNDTVEAGTNGWTFDGLWRQATDLYVSATHSWAYNNGSNYNTGARNSGSLVSPWIDLTNASSVLLTFKSWYQTEDTGKTWDRKQVFVSTDGATWAQVMQVSGLPTNQWASQACDLTFYAGRRIKVKFFFDTIDALNNQYRGWYVDDIQIAGQVVVEDGYTAYQDTMESGSNGWTAASLWRQATDLCASATHSWAYNNGSNYVTGGRTSGSLISPWIDLTAASSARLSFKSWYETEEAGTGWDKKLVYVTADGTNWTQLLQVSGLMREWTVQQGNLNAYCGQRIRLRFHFDSIDGLYNAFRGWYVDDVRVSIVASGILFFDDFGGGMGGWTRVAGAANWRTAGDSLRAWRIGNDDNIVSAGAAWTNYSVAADIRYNKFGLYYDDAELYVRFQDRNNFVKVLLENAYGFWRLKYVVRVQTNNLAQGWLHEFSKTNQPAEGVWHNLRVDAQGTNYAVYFDGQPAGAFSTPTNFAYTSGRIALGARAPQLGNWEPVKGYYFIDDDEYSYYAQPTIGSPLNLDWGYLVNFYGTLILPSTYVMNDAEASNVVTWINKGYYNIIATDGGIAMKDETGAARLGRVESIFGVAPSLNSLSGLTKATVGTNEHYVTLDYHAGDQVTAAGSANAWSAIASNRCLALGTLQNSVAATAPGLLACLTGPDIWSPAKVFCFNFAVDTGGQLTNQFRTVAQRAFEWTRGQAHKVVLQLKCPHPLDPNSDIALATATGWVLNGTGLTNVTFSLPTDGVMTGTNLYWVMYTYPWDAGYPWGAHDGFYTSGNDGKPVYVAGIGLQIMGITDHPYAGRAWDMYAAYNTLGSNYVMTFGIKDKGDVTDAFEDNFSDGNYSGWTVNAHPNVQWSVTNGALRAATVSTGGYAWITRDGLNVSNRNTTVEYDVFFDKRATNGGLVFRGRVLYINPSQIGWADDAPSYRPAAGLVTTGRWHHVIVSVRDGSPYWKSDVIVDANQVYANEAVQITNGWASSTVGFLSPYSPSGARTDWDNFRVADEQYSTVYETHGGFFIPTNVPTFWAYIPDYDPAMWEHAGTLMGADYEWFLYLRGVGLHDYFDTAVYFAPRLMVEDPIFPTSLKPGSTVNVPIEWENLDPLPAKMNVNLEDPYLGTTYVSRVFTITNATGSAYFSVTLPPALPSHANYLWVAYTYPTNSPLPFAERIGLDDTFRFDPMGLPIGPETTVTVEAVSLATDDFSVYRDLGIPAGCEVYKWGSGTINGDYTGITPPEGVKCFLATTPSSVGWGVFDPWADGRMAAYADGFLKFWLKCSNNVSVEIEGPQGTKRSVSVAHTTNQWKEISIPISRFSGVDLNQIMGYFSITIYTPSTFYVDDVRWTKGIYRVYNDGGIPANCTNFVWGGGPSSYNGDYMGDTPPEGVKCYLTTGSTWVGWGVFKTNTVDLSLFSNGYLRFWVKSTTNLKVQLEGPQGTQRTKYIPSTDGGWQEFALSATNFAGVNFSQLYGIFMIASDAGASFLVDDVRWIRGTNEIPSTPSELIYSDNGIPAGSDVFVWWASSYWAHVSALVNDGGFEQSTPNNLFPNSGYWHLSTAGAGATAICSSAAIYTGASGLRGSSGSGGAAYWCSTYQEYPAADQDVFRAEVQARQPAAGGWVSGSTAFLRLSFYDGWYQLLTNVVSSSKVTAASQAWTPLSIPDTKAPPGSSYVRVELVVQKPNGSNGVSTADFDDCVLRQGNSFNGQYGGDLNPPEGTRTFRSYCVSWSGWGIFYTNGTVNLSQYATGYLKFFLKSYGYTKVEIQSIAGGVTNTATGAFYGPTTNALGEVVWQHKVIPIANFTGVALTNIKSPFMATDPTYDHSYSIDYVRWEMGP